MGLGPAGTTAVPVRAPKSKIWVEFGENLETEFGYRKFGSPKLDRELLDRNIPSRVLFWQVVLVGSCIWVLFRPLGLN